MSGTRLLGGPPVVPSKARRTLRLAWVAVAFIPVSFVAAMVLGDWLLTRQGYESGAEVAPPVGVALQAGLPALAVLVVPPLLALWLGLRARRQGEPRGDVPAVVGGVVAGVAVLQNLGSLLLMQLFG